MRADNDLLREFAAANVDRLDRGAERSSGDGGSGPPGYEIVAEIHRGGQGVVYRAMQVATKRIVALKVALRATAAAPRLRHRLEREVELVASLRHRNIVTVYDSGVTEDGRLYLAMEFVDGVPLDAVPRGGGAAGRRLALERFCRIGDAVAHAHGRGIIHRDLKPANIIVDDAGEPHVLDFGVAKAIGADGTEDARLTTAAGEFVGTLAYAAPEQLSGDPSAIDVRTDVYALGVILYEMLAGRRPYDLRGSLRAAIDAIVAEVPPPPSRHDATISSDLDAIALTALAKDPERRYRSAAALTDDVRRALAGEAVEARRGDRGYMLRATIRRHRVPLAAAAMLFLVVSAVAFTMWRLYDRALLLNRKYAAVFAGMLDWAAGADQEDPGSPRVARTVRDLLDEGAQIAWEHLAAFPEDALALHERLGVAYMSRRDFTEAERHLRAAYDIARGRRTGPAPEVAEAMHNLGRLSWHTARLDEAESWYRAELAMLCELHHEDDRAIARATRHLASTLRRRGLLAEAEGLYREALAMSVDDPDVDTVANCLNGLGACLHDQGRYADAVSCFDRALAIIGGAEDDWRSARALHNLGRSLVDAGAFDRAGDALRRAVAIKRLTRDGDDPDVLRSRYELARLHERLGAHEDAEAECRAIIAAFPASDRSVAADRAMAIVLLARTLASRGEPAAAERELEEAIDAARVALGDDHPSVALLRSTREAFRAGRGP
jgi:tetratricopeptide (TPR) repeat protein/predicted Ser/Thr protein kinase